MPALKTVSLPVRDNDYPTDWTMDIFDDGTIYCTTCLFADSYKTIEEIGADCMVVRFNASLKHQAVELEITIWYGEDYKRTTATVFGKKNKMMGCDLCSALRNAAYYQAGHAMVDWAEYHNNKHIDAEMQNGVRKAYCEALKALRGLHCNVVHYLYGQDDEEWGRDWKEAVLDWAERATEMHYGLDAACNAAKYRR